MNVKVGNSGTCGSLTVPAATIISKNGRRDGEDVSNYKDSNGNPFIEEICRMATGLKDGEIAEYTYSRKNADDDPKPRTKVVKVMYYKPWDSG